MSLPICESSSASDPVEFDAHITEGHSEDGRLCRDLARLAPARELCSRSDGTTFPGPALAPASELGVEADLQISEGAYALPASRCSP